MTQTHASADLLTEAEHTALAMTRDLANQVTLHVIASGREFRADHSEFTRHIHAIQHMIMAQAAARAYPEEYRLLGRGHSG
jgi:hypothetical protein